MANGTESRKRQTWGTRLGVILAVAGSAVGLGNFLRFPSIAVENGGGAFMIPYFIAFLLLGIPLGWVEWTMGRFGGRHARGSAPGILDALGDHKPYAKYLGVIGVAGPLLIYFYYVYIESWTLGYAWFAMTGKLSSLSTQTAMVGFLHGYQGVENNNYFSSIGPAYLFFLITIVLNFGVIYLGIVHGIERVSKIAMPLLAILGVVLAIRVLTLGAPDAAHSTWNVDNGLGFMWNPSFKDLKKASVWLAAAGQIFFTLSVGMGVILTYASYLKPKDDVALSGLTASATNEFMEVIIGGSMVIPAAVVFYGMSHATKIAAGGTFNLGFVTMPLIFTKMHGGPLFCVLWFLLLFIAGITSSISMIQPSISFLEDEFRMSRKQAVGWTALVCFGFSQLAIFGLARGFVNEMDNWAGSLFLVVFALIEVVFFAWVFGMDRGWKELHEGAEIGIPRIYKFIIQYITPLFILAVLISFVWQNFDSFFRMHDSAYGKDWSWNGRLPVLLLRCGIFAFIGFVCWLVHYSWKRHPKHARPVE